MQDRSRLPPEPRSKQHKALRGSVLHRLWPLALVVVLTLAVTIRTLGASAQSNAQPPSHVEGIEVGELEPVGSVTIRHYEPPVGASAGVDSQGRPIKIACMTCHSTRTPNRDNSVLEDLDEFHQGLHIAHGGLSCLSCHNQDDYGSLQLASGQRVDYADVQTMCAQCHSKTVQSYEHGAHGGMTGYWDLSRGGRVRNSCLHCHDPHAPAIQRMQPTFKPKDRFLEASHD